MNEEKVVLSVKVDPASKELLAEGAAYLKINQGDLMARSIKRYMTDETNYVQNLTDAYEKIVSDFDVHALVIEARRELFGETYKEIAEKGLDKEGSLKNSSNELLQREIQEFCDIHCLWDQGYFEGVPPEKVTPDMIERSDYFPEWALFVSEEIENKVLEKIDAKKDGILKVSNDLLLMLMPSLKRALSVEIEVQFRLMDRAVEMTMGAHLELISKSLNRTATGFHVGRLLRFFEQLTADEETWFRTTSYLLDSEFKNKIPPVEQATEFLNKIFTQKPYAIFELVDVDSVIEKAIQTP